MKSFKNIIIVTLLSLFIMGSSIYGPTGISSYWTRSGTTLSMVNEV